MGPWSDTVVMCVSGWMNVTLHASVFFKNYLFILATLGLHSCCAFLSLVAVSWELLSSCGVWASHCHDFSSFRALALGHMGLISCSSWALEHRLNSCGPQA